MVTLKHYMDLGQAERDKCLLDAAEIPVFLAGENSAAIGYASILGELRLQVQETDVDRARRVLDEHEGFSPLPDDFIPPEEPPEPRPTRRTGGGAAFLWGAIITLAVFGIAAALAIGASGSAYATVSGLMFLCLLGGLVGMAVRALYNKGRADRPTSSRG